MAPATIDQITKGRPHQLCDVCGVLVAIDGFPYGATHIWGPVTDIATGLDYPGHPVTAVRVLEEL